MGKNWQKEYLTISIFRQVPKIFSFRAIRPSEGMEGQVSASTHETKDSELLTKMLEENPFSYLHIVKPYLHFAEEKDPSKHFPFAKNYISQLLSQNVLKTDDQEAFYFYRQTVDNKTYTALIATVSVEDYNNNAIKKHENTITQKEDQLAEHIKITGVIGEPVLLSHTATQKHDDLFKEVFSQMPTVEFVSDDGVQHKVWVITDTSLHSRIKEAYGEVGDFYIADGHHRSAAAAKCINQIRNSTESNVLQSGGNFMVALVPENQLGIFSFYRLLKDVHIADYHVFCSQLAKHFEVKKSDSICVPNSEYEFGVCTQFGWLLLRLREEPKNTRAVSNLNVKILEELILDNILEVKDSKTDERIFFLSGKTPITQIENMVKRGEASIAFVLSPTSIQNVKEVADQNDVMPPKSTYFEPKFRTGLVIQRI